MRELARCPQKNAPKGRLRASFCKRKKPPSKGIYKVARRTQTTPVGLPNAASQVTKELMGRSLVIVESPAKAKTINKYLGKNYTVKASIGHVMDLPTKTIGIRLPGEDPSGKKKVRKKKGAKKSARADAK